MVGEDASGDGQRISRRSTFKHFSAGAVGLLFGSGPVGGQSDSTHRRNTVKLPNPDTTVVKYDDSLYDITGHPYLLALSESAIDRHFSASSIKGHEYESSRRYIENLRARYPVEVVTKANERRFQLSEQARKNLNNERRSAKPLLESTDKQLNRAAPSEGGVPAVQNDRDYGALVSSVGVFGSEDSNQEMENVDPEWSRDHHVDLLNTAAFDVGTAADFNEWAKEPDNFSEWARGALDKAQEALDIVLFPDFVGEEWVEDKLLDIVTAPIGIITNNYTQYYDPTVITIPVPIASDIKIGDFGMAPQAFALFYDKASSSGGSYWKRRFTAWASHYLHDVANPLHSGMGIEQAGLVWDISVETSISGDPIDITLDYTVSLPKDWLHTGFERHIRNEYYSQFRQHFSGDDYLPIYSPESAIKNVSEESEKYSDDIFHTVLENETSGENDPSEWSSYTKSIITNDLDNCFSICGKYQRQLLADQGFGEGACPQCQVVGERS